MRRAKRLSLSIASVRADCAVGRGGEIAAVVVVAVAEAELIDDVWVDWAAEAFRSSVVVADPSSSPSWAGKFHYVEFLVLVE